MRAQARFAGIAMVLAAVCGFAASARADNLSGYTHHLNRIVGVFDDQVDYYTPTVDQPIWIDHERTWDDGTIGISSHAIAGGLSEGTNGPTSVKFTNYATTVVDPYGPYAQVRDSSAAAISAFTVTAHGMHVEVPDGKTLPPHLGIEVTVNLTYTMSTSIHQLPMAVIGADANAYLQGSFGSDTMGGSYSHDYDGTILSTGALAGALDNTLNQTFTATMTQIFDVDAGTKADLSVTSYILSVAGASTPPGWTDDFAYSGIDLHTQIEFSSRPVPLPGGGPVGGPELFEYYIVSDDGVITRDGFNRDLFVPAPGVGAVAGAVGLLTLRRRR